MKTEMGESLIYTWLRHIRGCQVVQTNWKTSPRWELAHTDELEALHAAVDSHFQEAHGYQIFKRISSLSQIIRQGECDALGAAFRDGTARFCAVDVAFHESGLLYGSRVETVSKVINKSIRTAMCLYGFFGVREAEVLFASPKVNPSQLSDMIPCVRELQDLTEQAGFGFTFRVLVNEDFREQVLSPVLAASREIADTSELFLRSCQLLRSSGVRF